MSSSPAGYAAPREVHGSTASAIEALQTALNALVASHGEEKEAKEAQLAELNATREQLEMLQTDVHSLVEGFGAKHFLVEAPDAKFREKFARLGFRSAMNNTSIMQGAENGVEWGKIVCAIPVDENWVVLRPGRFMPTKITGSSVLTQLQTKPTLVEIAACVKGRLAMLNSNAAEIQTLRSERDALANEKSLLQSERDDLANENSRLQSDRDALANEKALLQSERDDLANENSRLQEWPSFTLHPWRLKEALPTTVWNPVDGAPPTVMHGQFAQDTPMWRHVVNLFKAGVNPYHVLSIHALHSEDGLKIFEGTLARLEQRRQEGGIFDADISLDDPSRKVVIDRLKTHFLRQPPCLQLANVVFVWHGGSSDAISGITRNGFADLKRTDDGWFGSALYATTDARYACMYSTGEISSIGPSGSGPWKVVLAAMAMSHAFPVTRADYPAGQRYCKYKGKPLETGYYSHAVVVDPEDGYQAARDPAAPGFKPLEVLAAQEGQLIPLAVIEFQ